MTNILATVVLSVLFQNMHRVENRDNIKGVHRDGVSYGYVGTTQGCLDDVNAHYKTHYRLRDMNDPVLSFEVFQKYTDLRLMVKHLEPTHRNRLLVWHAASDPAEQERYIRAVEEEIEKVAGGTRASLQADVGNGE